MSPKVFQGSRRPSDLPHMTSTTLHFSTVLSDPSMLMAMVALGGPQKWSVGSAWVLEQRLLGLVLHLSHYPALGPGQLL